MLAGANGKVAGRLRICGPRLVDCVGRPGLGSFDGVKTHLLGLHKVETEQTTQGSTMLLNTRVACVYQSLTAWFV